VARALRLLEADPAVFAVWRDRCQHLLVDESQDLDRAQLRLALLLAAPANQIFLVGDDDQSIYGWRLADVRRLLGLADEALPGITRVDLETNYRCPAPVLERAVRLVEHNQERFAKMIRAGPKAAGRLVLAPSAADDVDRACAVLASWPADDGTQAVLARTNRELMPVMAAALRLGLPFRATGLVLPIESPVVDELIAAAGGAASTRPALLALGALAEWRHAETLRSDVEGDEGDREARAGSDDSIASGARAPRAARAHSGNAADGPDETALSERRSVVASMLGWAAAHATVAALASAIEVTRRSLEELRRDDARLVLATAHGTKGLEFDHVAVIGLDVGRFPSARSVAEAVEPVRALEEERRLAYVAWTRARRSLTLVYDPGAPSQFLLEAFDRTELGLQDRSPK
jgi:DNA helicase-2/ATP-dependent DNA helicase PcrA